MKRVAKFEKVSYEQFETAWKESFSKPSMITDKTIKDAYYPIELPQRATKGSAGYDFYSPLSFVLEPGETIKIPTGIRCEMYDGWVLMGFPRSGLGFKYGLSMANTVSIIDGDYFDSDNEGNFFVKLTNNSCLAKEIRINKGDAFSQGIFLPFGITLDDDTTTVRNGGLGSTDAK